MHYRWLLPALLIITSTTGQSRSGYDEGLARRLINLAAAAYGTEYQSCIDRTYSPQQQYYVYGSTTVECDVLRSTCEFFITVSNVTREAIVVFRGTKTTGQLLVEGWQSDQTGEDFLGMGNVNKYFRRAHDQLWPSVLDFYAHPEFQNYRITITGHSLGAALASLAAARTVKEGYRPGNAVLMYTFGQPRTGSYPYAMSFDALGIRSYRVVYSSDIIPHSPGCKKDDSVTPLPNGSRQCLAAPSDNAYHHGIEIWYPQSMLPGSQYIECTGLPRNEDINCSDQLTFDSNASDLYAYDHRDYFGLFVTGYGKSGCTNTTTSAPPVETGGGLGSTIRKLVNIVGKRDLSRLDDVLA